MPVAAAQLLDRLALLASPPTNAKQFLIADLYGRGDHGVTGEMWKQQLFDGLAEMSKESLGEIKVAFVDFLPLWDAVMGSKPGYKAFGYTSKGGCFPTTSPPGMEYSTCDDPDHTFYWLNR